MTASKNSKLRLGALLLSTFGILLTVGTGPSHAQSLTTGGVSGNITDATGAAIPNATVMLIDVDNGSVQTASSNGSGEFRFSLLKPGHYTVSTTVSGFEKVEWPIEFLSENVVRLVELRWMVTNPDGRTMRLTHEGAVALEQELGITISTTRAKLSRGE